MVISQAQRLSQHATLALASLCLIVVLGPWMLDQLVSWAQNLYSSIPSLIG